MNQEASIKNIAATLLLIDDEANIRAALTRLFRPCGYTILTAESGAAAFELLEQNAVDLVICDMRMPEMSGAEVLEQIRIKWPEVVRILLTGYADIDLIIAAINRGEIYRYIAKPWDDNDIVLTVRDALEHKHLLVEKQRLETLTLQQNEKIKRLYNQIVIEQKISNRLLLNILPRVVVERLKRSSKAVAETQEFAEENLPPLIADSFPDVTVLFADIVGFTHFSMGVSPEKLVVLLNEIFSEFDRIADQCGLEKIKTIGDAYMAVAGVPSYVEGHAVRAAQMALDMMDALKVFNQRNGYTLQMRVGINSGAVVAGIIGKRKFIYDLWGDAVNIASRMESHGVAGRVQLTDATRQRLGEGFLSEERGVIEIKGVGELHTWFLTGHK
jgi:adenylate cyclase